LKAKLVIDELMSQATLENNDIKNYINYNYKEKADEVGRLGGIVEKVTNNFKSLKNYRGKHLKRYYKY